MPGINTSGMTAKRANNKKRLVLEKKIDKVSTGRATCGVNECSIFIL
jgi:hypothetical protein